MSLSYYPFANHQTIRTPFLERFITHHHHEFTIRRKMGLTQQKKYLSGNECGVCKKLFRLLVISIVVIAQEFATSFQTTPASPLSSRTEQKPSALSNTVKSAAVELQELAKKSGLRQRGSSRYRKAWTHWKHSAVDSIRQELERTLPHPVNQVELESLSFSLGVAADTGKMPSFEAAGARSGYALNYFCRALLLADLLILVNDDDVDNHAPLQGNAEKGSVDPSPYNLTSLGGGPGFDFVACALVSSFRSAGDSSRMAAINATILDYEPGWEKLVDAMNEATQNVLPSANKMISSRWGGLCDITKPLGDPTNSACLDVVDSTSIWTCQYCVAENAQQLRDSEYVFFRDLFHAATAGSLFVITETTPRLWPDFYDLVLEHNANKNENHCLQIAFPYVRGSHMAIYKANKKKSGDIPVVVSPQDLEKLRSFEAYSCNHEKLMETGWERQKSKRQSREFSGAAVLMK
eukprot:scaffold3236_cov66-Cylindrotheca_fusiformis.AAC.6